MNDINTLKEIRHDCVVIEINFSKKTPLEDVFHHLQELQSVRDFCFEKDVWPDALNFHLLTIISRVGRFWAEIKVTEK